MSQVDPHCFVSSSLFKIALAHDNLGVMIDIRNYPLLPDKYHLDSQGPGCTVASPSRSEESHIQHLPTLSWTLWTPLCGTPLEHF